MDTAVIKEEMPSAADSVFTKKGSPLAGDTVRAVEFGFAALLMMIAFIRMIRKRRQRKNKTL